MMELTNGMTGFANGTKGVEIEEISPANGRMSIRNGIFTDVIAVWGLAIGRTCDAIADWIRS
jgi:hypothetical protein